MLLSTVATTAVHVCILQSALPFRFEYSVHVICFYFKIFSLDKLFGSLMNNWMEGFQVYFPLADKDLDYGR